jgi:hypothetical protein
MISFTTPGARGPPAPFEPLAFTPCFPPVSFHLTIHFLKPELKLPFLLTVSWHW